MLRRNGETQLRCRCLMSALGRKRTLVAQLSVENAQGAGATLATDEYIPAVDVAVSNSVALLASHKLDSLEVAWQAFSAHRGRVDQLIVEVGKQGAPR